MGGTLTKIAGSITVTNTADDSTLSLDDSGDTKARTGTLSATAITGLGMPSGVAVNYDGAQLAMLTLRGGTGGATLTETGTSCPTDLIGITVSPSGEQTGSLDRMRKRPDHPGLFGASNPTT